MAQTLAQALAVVRDVRTRSERTMTDADRILSKAPLLSGVRRTYAPLADGDVVYPPESQRVQVNAAAVLGDVTQALTRALDAAATTDWANTQARADVVVDTRILVEAVPVTYLMYLDKVLDNVRTLVDRLPVLDAADDWTPDDSERGVYRTQPVGTIRNRKVPKALVLAPATDKHPAQVQAYTEDVPEGTWTTVKLSGAVPAAWRRATLERIDVLRRAVKKAQWEANGAEAPAADVGARLLSYVFDGH